MPVLPFWTLSIIPIFKTMGFLILLPFFTGWNKAVNHTVVGQVALLVSDQMLLKYSVSKNSEYLHTNSSGVNRSDGLEK
jgi:hypothetical protein